MRVVAYMLSCSARDEVRIETLRRLGETDWAAEAVVVLDEAEAERPQARQVETSERLLRKAASDGTEFVLFMEDDLDFNHYLRHNLDHWHPLVVADPDYHFMASLYNPNVGVLETRDDLAYAIANPNLVYGSQAFLLSRATVQHVLAHWRDVVGGQDIKISHIAATSGPIYYHRPSLVQHMPVPSTWGGRSHSAIDFSPGWRA